MLFTAVLAAVVGVPMASANLESKTYNVNGTDVTMTTYVGNMTGINPQTVSLLDGTSTSMLGFEMTGGYFNANPVCDKDIYISKGTATGTTKTGLVFTNGNEYKVLTFTGDVYGNGDIHKQGNPSNGLTLKFTGDMSAYTGAITIEGASGKNILTFDGATTGTGTITTNCAVTLNNATISNSSIKTSGDKGSVTISGKTAIATGKNVNITSTATNLNLNGTLDTDKGTITFNGDVTAQMNLTDIIIGEFVRDVQLENGGVDGNGYVTGIDNVKLFSNTNNATISGTVTCTIGGTSVTVSNGVADASGVSVGDGIYLLSKDETYGAAMSEAKTIMVQNNATLTLNETLSNTLTGGIMLQGANSIVALGDNVLLNKSSVATVGDKGKLTGTGTYDLGAITTIDLGAVNLSEFSGTVKATQGHRGTNLTGFNDIGSGAKLELSGFTGYHDEGELKTNLILTNSADGYAVRLDNGSSGSDRTGTFSGSIEGTGNMVYTWDVVDSGQVYKTTHVFTGDTSQWKGKFVRELIDSAGEGTITIGKLTEVKFTAGGDVFHTDGTGGVEDKAVVSRTSVIIESAKDTTFNGSITNVKDVITNSNTDYKQAITTQAFTVKEAVTVGIFSDVTTTSLTLGTDATLEFAGGVLNVTDSYTLNAGCITLAEGLTFKTADDYTLFNVTGENNTLTMVGLDSWSGSNYLIEGVEYSTALLQDGNSLKLSFNKVIPEPTTATLSLLALAGLAARRRRK